MQAVQRIARLPCHRHLGLQARRINSVAHSPSAGLGVERLAARRPVANRLRAGQLAPQRLHVRCLASKGSDGEKSWSEIAKEAAQLGTDLVKKVGSAVGKAVTAVTTTKEEEEARPQRRESRGGRKDIYRSEDLGFGGGLVGGLLGRAVGGMLKSAVGALGEQLREAAQQVAEVQERAARTMQSNSKLRERMGGSVQVMAPVSQSSMSSSINGRMTRTVTLIMPVVGANGRAAQAQVQYVEGRDGAVERMDIAVQLPSGEVLNLDGGSSPAGQTIDVEWRSVDDK